jgi:hypothetical protein
LKAKKTTFSKQSSSLPSLPSRRAESSCSSSPLAQDGLKKFDLQIREEGAFARSGSGNRSPAGTDEGPTDRPVVVRSRRSCSASLSLQDALHFTFIILTRNVLAHRGKGRLEGTIRCPTSRLLSRSFAAVPPFGISSTIFSQALALTFKATRPRMSR